MLKIETKFHTTVSGRIQLDFYMNKNNNNGKDSIIVVRENLHINSHQIV